MNSRVYKGIDFGISQLDEISDREYIVFICYSWWEGEGHKEWVERLSKDLREKYHISTLLDSYQLPGESIPVFIEQGIKRSGNVLIIGTPSYRERTQNNIGWAGEEFSLIAKEIASNPKTDKFIPVLRKGPFKEAFPDIIKEGTELNFENDDRYEDSLSNLANRLIHNAEVVGLVKNRKKDLTPGNFVASAKVIGRDALLIEIRAALEKNHRLIVNGTLGVGKTSLVQKTYRNLQNDYDKTGWLTYEGSAKNAILSGLNLYKDIVDVERRWDAVRNYLFHGPRILLVFDHVEVMDGGMSPYNDPFWELAELADGHLDIVLTTRKTDWEVPSFAKVTVDELDAENAIKVFQRYYSMGKPRKRLSDRDKETIRNIIGIVGGNALVLELIASVAKYKPDLSQYYEKLKIACGFHQMPEKPNGQRDDGIPEKSKAVLPGSKGMEVLLSFACLPPKFALGGDFLRDWFGFDKADLTDIVKGYGLLVFDPSTEKYSMSPVIHEIIRMSFSRGDNNGKAPSCSAKFFLDKIRKGLADNYFDQGATIAELRERIQIVESVLETTGTSIDDSEQILLNMSKACERAHLPREVIKYYGRFVKLQENRPETEDTFLADCYRWLAKRCKDEKETESLHTAEEYQRKAIRILKKRMKPEDPDLAVLYHEMATIFLASDKEEDIDKALRNENKAIKIRKKACDYPQLDMAESFHNKSLGYFAKGKEQDIVRSMMYQQAALAIRKQSLPSDHQDIALSYYHLATIARRLGGKGFLEFALQSQKMAIRIFEKNPDQNELLLAAAYSNMGAILYDLGGEENLLLAQRRLIDAIRIMKANLEPGSRALAMVYLKMAQTCSALGGEDNLRKALQYRKLASQFSDEQPTPSMLFV